MAESKPLAFIIEDDQRQATIFAQALRRAEFDTEIILDGNLALIRLRAITPVLVVLDLNLPYVPGEDILRWMQTEERLANTQVILTTANSMVAEELQGINDLILLKPISFNQLRDLAKRLHPSAVTS